MFNRTTQCMRGVLDPSVLAFRISLYRHPSIIYIFFSSRFTTDKQRIIQSKKNSANFVSEKVGYYHTPFSKKTEGPGEGSPSTDNFKPVADQRKKVCTTRMEDTRRFPVVDFLVVAVFFRSIFKHIVCLQVTCLKTPTDLLQQ